MVTQVHQKTQQECWRHLYSSSSQTGNNPDVSIRIYKRTVLQSQNRILSSKENKELWHEKRGWISSAQCQGKKSDGKAHVQHIQVIQIWSSKPSCSDRNHEQSALGGRTWGIWRGSGMLWWSRSWTRCLPGCAHLVKLHKAIYDPCAFLHDVTLQ